MFGKPLCAGAYREGVGRLMKLLCDGGERRCIRCNFQRYPGQQTIHACVGAGAVHAAVIGWPAVGGLIAAYQIGRQGLEWGERRDTVGLDMMWCLTGVMGRALVLYGLGV